MKNRDILHCDCNSFFASVELLSYPELRDKPVVVGGSEELRHGIVLAKNEAAKKLGIQTAQTIGSARQRCPELIVLPPHHDRYRYYSKIINEIYGHYTDLVEPFGIDESWLDVTNSYHLFAQSPKELADMIRERVYFETGLTLSVGVSFNKIFAKLGSDYKKPNATTVISRDNYKEIVFPLKVGDLLYVGKTTQQALAAMGIFTIGQLAQKSESFLQDRFGKHGAELYLFANGLDDSEVLPYDSEKEYKSMGSGNTFSRDITTLAEIKTALMVQSEEVGLRVRKHGLYANGVQVSIKNPQFVTINRQRKIPSTFVSKTIYEAALKLLLDNWKQGEAIRAITVTAIDLTKEKAAKQISLFEQTEEKGGERAEKLQGVLDKIRDKFGEGAVKNAIIIKNDIFDESAGKGDKDDDETLF